MAVSWLSRLTTTRLTRQHRLRLLESTPNLAPPNILKRDLRVRLHLQNIARLPLITNTRSNIPSIQPGHESALIPPDRKAEDHTAGKRITHLSHTSQLLEATSTARSSAVLIIHNADFRAAWDLDGRRFDVLPVLDVAASDFVELTLFACNKLGDNGKVPESVDSELWAGAVEALVSDGIWILAASPLITDTFKGILFTGSLIKRGDVARMWGQMGSTSIAFPDVELGAAGALAFNVGLRLKLASAVHV